MEQLKTRRVGRRWLVLALVLTLLLILAGCGSATGSSSGGGSSSGTSSSSSSSTIDKNGTYTSPEDVAAYIHKYSKLPSNFITKAQAKKLGWDSESGNLDKVAPGKSIGGDSFANREKKLPVKSGRKYYECDVNYTGGHRGAERLIYSSDGLVYYTNDHYSSFKEM